MTLALYRRVVLKQDLPEEGFRAGDVGVIVEHYPARAGVPEGCLIPNDSRLSLSSLHVRIEWVRVGWRRRLFLGSNPT